MPPTPSPVPNRTPLFRSQALANSRHKLHGNILLARPVSFSVLTSVFAGVAFAIILLFAFFGYARKVSVAGLLVPNTGVTRVVAGQQGTIIERPVAEGQSIRRGDILFVLSSERTTVAMGEAEGSISALLGARRQSLTTEMTEAGNQGRQRAAAAAKRAADLADEARQIERQISLQSRRVSLAEDAQKRHKKLEAAGYISPAQLQDKTAELLDQQQRLQDLQRALTATRRDLRSAESERDDLLAQAQRDQLTMERNIASIDQDLMENEARRRIVIRAPVDGIVTALVAEPGQTVALNQPLGSIVPEGAAMEAELYAPTRAVGLIKPDQQVTIRYQAFPYQKFGLHSGTIREVSRTALRPDELGSSIPSQDKTEPLYRIRVSLDRQSVLAYGKAQTLRPGMLLDASIVMEERKLYEWVLEPLFSIGGKL